MSVIKDFYKEFNFGAMKDDTENFKEIVRELEDRNLYAVLTDVKDGDVIMDLGASVGCVSWLSVSHCKNLKHIFMVEPDTARANLIRENFKNINNYTVIEKIVSNKSSEMELVLDYGGNASGDSCPCITFQKLTENIPRVDVLKIDIEGSEYDIFTEENLNYLTSCVGNMVVEFHLGNKEDKEKFRNLRDNYIPKLMVTKTIDTYSVDGINQNWHYWTESFIQYYNQFMMVFKENR